MFSPIDLQYFRQIAESLNISRASERLGISQPTLSASLKRLETSLNLSLVIRHKKGVYLSPAGKILLAHAKQMLEYWETISSKASDAHHCVQGTFKIGCPEVISARFFQGFMPDILQKHPRLSVSIEHNISRILLEQVAELALDMAIVVNPIRHPDLVIIKLFKDETRFWRSAEITNANLSLETGEGVILCNQTLTQAQLLLKKIKHPYRIMDCNSLFTILSLTAAGAGIGILPKSLALSNPAAPLEMLPQMPSVSDEVCLVYRHEHRHVRAVQVISEAIKASFKVQ